MICSICASERHGLYCRKCGHKHPYVGGVWAKRLDDRVREKFKKGHREVFMGVEHEDVTV